MKLLTLEKRLDYKPHRPVSLGCNNCLEAKVCGGIQLESGHFDCTSFCTCANPDTCAFVCPRDLKKFVERSNEVGGYEFDTIPHSKPLKYSELPLVVPMIYHRSSRTGVLRADAVVIPLRHLFDYRKGRLRFESKEALAKHFRFDPRAKLVISGVDKDRFIEPYWAVVHETELVAQLRELRPALVTTPNYSIFLNAPRWDHLHNMKRILICWAELNACGVPASLHINAFTDKDWERWSDFIRDREEVQSITVEFGTGLMRKITSQRFLEKLLSLASVVPRKLNLVLRGGKTHLSRLTEAKAFASVTLLDTNSFMRTINRKEQDLKSGQRHVWKAADYEKGRPVDDLFQANYENIRLVAASQVSR